MVDEVPDFKDREAAKAWLRTQPREVSVAIAARAALRAAALFSDEIKTLDEVRNFNVELVLFRGVSVSWLSINLRSEEIVSRAFLAADAAARAKDSDAVRAVFCASYAASEASHDNEPASYAVDALNWLMRKAKGRDVAHLDDDVVERALIPAELANAPLWPNGVPSWAIAAWSDLKSRLLARDEGWEVWTDWYEARVRGGDPVDWDLERARVLIPVELWAQGPAVVNAAIARLIADRAAAAPHGETLGIDPTTLRITAFPPPLENPAVVANAVEKVADALADFRASGLGNRAAALNPVLRSLDRALSEYRDDPQRLHDDFGRAAANIGAEIARDPDLAEIPVTDLRDICAEGAIDIRIGVKAISDMEADRRRRRPRKPSAASLAATRSLLAQTQHALSQPIHTAMTEDVTAVESSPVADGGDLPEGEARDADIRLSNRLAWLHRFSRMPQAEIVALAARLGRHADDVEHLVNLYRAFDDWWPILSLIIRGS